MKIREAVEQLTSIRVENNFTEEQHRSAASELMRFLEENGVRHDFDEQGPMRTGSGLAVSPRAAYGLPTLDPLRFAYFASAFDHALERCLSGVDPIDVLYVGCGPIAALILPSILKRPGLNLKIHLVEVHRATLDAAIKVAQNLNWADRIASIHCKDAAELNIEEIGQPKIVIGELIDFGLKTETHLGVFAHLREKFGDSPIYIPDKVEVATLIGAVVDEHRCFFVVDRGRLIPADGVTYDELSHRISADWHFNPPIIGEEGLDSQASLKMSIAFDGIRTLVDHTCISGVAPLRTPGASNVISRCQISYVLGGGDGEYPEAIINSLK